MINFEKKNTSVSVVIPAYNEENTIGALIEALLNQTYLPDEIIINYKKLIIHDYFKNIIQFNNNNNNNNI